MRGKFPLLLLVVLGLTLAIGCSKVPENNDPVIGIWSLEKPITGTTEKGILREEWIFNDVYRGRYHRYEGSEITLKNDFQWESRQGFYHINYPGLDKQADVVQIVLHEGSERLQNPEGTILAERE